MYEVYLSYERRLKAHYQLVMDLYWKYSSME